MGPVHTWAASDGRRGRTRSWSKSSAKKNSFPGTGGRALLAVVLAGCYQPISADARLTTTLHLDLEGDMLATDGLDCSLCTHVSETGPGIGDTGGGRAAETPVPSVSWVSRRSLDMLAVFGATGWPIEIHAAIAATSAALAAAAAPPGTVADPYVPLLCLFVEAERDLLEAEECESPPKTACARRRARVCERQSTSACWLAAHSLCPSNTAAAPSPSPLTFSPLPTLCLCHNFSQMNAMICSQLPAEMPSSTPRSGSTMPSQHFGSRDRG